MEKPKLTPEQRRQNSDEVIRAAEATIRAGGEIDMSTVDIRETGSETITYLQMLRRRGAAGLVAHDITL